MTMYFPKFLRPLALLAVGMVDVQAESQTSVPLESLWLDAPPALQKDCAPALQDLHKYYPILVGKDLPGQDGDGLIPLRLKLQEKQAEDATYAGRGRAGDYVIAVSTGEVVIEGKTPLAITNGIYGFLDMLGCRWAFPGDLGAFIPSRAGFRIPLGRTVEKIASDPRILSGPPFYYSEGEVGDWVRRNRFGKESTVTAHHSWASLIVPAGVYNDPSKPDTYHPEYFSLVGGKRSPGIHSDKLQICTTNPDVIRMGVEKAKSYLRDNPGLDTFPCSPEDNFEFCQCPTCLSLDAGELTPEGVPSASNRVMAYVNEIARGIREEFPDRLVSLYAYNNYTLPPTKIVPEPNVMVHITRMNYDLLRLVPRIEGDSSAKFQELVESWKKLTPYIYLYEYNPVYWAGGLLSPNYLEYARSVKYFRDLGVLGFSSDPGELPFRNTINFLNDYLAMRAAVDADSDPSTELAAICRDLYGPGGDAMTRYFEILAKVTEAKGLPGDTLGGGIRHFHRIFTPEMIREAGAALAEAKSKVGSDETARKRLRLAEAGFKYLTAYLDVVWAARDGDYEKSLKSYKQVTRMIDTLGANKTFDPTGRQAIIRGGALMAWAEYCPDQAGFPRNWKVLGPFDNSSRTGEVEFASVEPVLNVGRPVTLEDGRTLTWKDYHSPVGYLDLGKALPETPAGWSARTAYAALTVVADQPIRAKLEMNSFNSFRVYLNGKEIFYRPGQQLDLPDANKIEADFQKGENTLVFRCTETASSEVFPWALYVRIFDPNLPQDTQSPSIRFQ